MSSVMRFDEWQDSNGVPVASGAGGVFTAPGTILQVVSTTKSDTFSSSSSTFTDITGLSASITPSSTSNKVLAFCTFGCIDADAIDYVDFRFDRDGTVIGGGSAVGNRLSAGIRLVIFANNRGQSASWSYLDSPSSTSSLTYGVEGRVGAGTTFYINRTSTDSDTSQYTRQVSSLTLLEVAA